MGASFLKAKRAKALSFHSKSTAIFNSFLPKDESVQQVRIYVFVFTFAVFNLNFFVCN